MKSAVLTVALAVCAWSQDNPATLVSESEAEPIHSAIVRQEAWTVEPVRNLRLRADRYMKEGPWSVTFERPTGLILDVHEYYSQAPYYWPQDDPRAPYLRRDGQTNPNRFTANKNAMTSMSEAVFALGAGAFLLDEPRYAKRAARILRVWFIDPGTRMYPALEYAQSVRNMNGGRGTGVIDGHLLIQAIQGMEFLSQTGLWNTREQAAVRKWFQEYLHWLTASERGLEAKSAGDNRATWWTAQVAAVASFVGDEPAQNLAWTWYREQILGKQILPNGAAPREDARAKSLSYSVYNLEAMTVVCRIAQVHGVDLWSAKAKNGATLAAVIDYLHPFVSDPKKWPREQIAEFSSEGLYSLAFAGMGMKRPEYLALYHRLDHGETAWLALVDLLVGRWEAAGHQTRH